MHKETMQDGLSVTRTLIKKLGNLHFSQHKFVFVSNNRYFCGVLEMNYIEFHNQWSVQGIFNTYEIEAWLPTFDKNNLTRWIAKGYIVRLRRGWYAFSEALHRPDYNYVVAERIYRPSYISLQSAFCIYDLIPEAVIGITSVTSLKTAKFETALGQYSYYSVKPNLMFGYKPVLTSDGRAWFLAYPEKAILDFLYLNPQYKSEQDMEELRFDEYFMSEELNRERFESYLLEFDSTALAQRIDILKKTYGI